MRGSSQSDSAFSSPAQSLTRTKTYYMCQNRTTGKAYSRAHTLRRGIAYVRASSPGLSPIKRNMSSDHNITVQELSEEISHILTHGIGQPTQQACHPSANLTTECACHRYKRACGSGRDPRSGPMSYSWETCGSVVGMSFG